MRSSVTNVRHLCVLAVGAGEEVGCVPAGTARVNILSTSGVFEHEDSLQAGCWRHDARHSCRGETLRPFPPPIRRRNNGDLLFFVTNTLTQVTDTFVLSANQINSYFSTATATSTAQPLAPFPTRSLAKRVSRYSFGGDTALQSLITAGGADVQVGHHLGCQPRRLEQSAGSGLYAIRADEPTDASVTALTQAQISGTIPSGYCVDLSNLVLSNADQTGLTAGVTGTSAGIFGTPTTLLPIRVGAYGTDLKEPVSIGSTAFKLYGSNQQCARPAARRLCTTWAPPQFDGSTLNFSGSPLSAACCSVAVRKRAAGPSGHRPPPRTLTLIRPV